MQFHDSPHRSAPDDRQSQDRMALRDRIERLERQSKMEAEALARTPKPNNSYTEDRLVDAKRTHAATVSELAAATRKLREIEAQLGIDE
jgi:hypothetical protein